MASVSSLTVHWNFTGSKVRSGKRHIRRELFGFAGGSEHPDFVLVFALEFSGAIQLVAKNVAQSSCVYEAVYGFFDHAKIARAVDDKVYVAFLTVHV